MTSVEAIAVSGAKRTTFRRVNPRELLGRIIDEMPNESEQKWREEFWTRANEDDRYLEAIANWWLDNNIVAATSARRKGSSRTLSAMTDKELAAQLERHISKIVLLDMIMPNGKKLRHCTGEECVSFGGWLSMVGAKTGKRSLVGAKMSESALQAFYSASMSAKVSNGKQ